MKTNGQWAITYTLLDAYTDFFRWKSTDLLTYYASINSIHADQLSNAISQPSWFLDVVTSMFARHSLTAVTLLTGHVILRKKIIKNTWEKE